MTGRRPASLYPSIPDVGGAVESRSVDEGVVPIENSVGGSVSVTLDLLIHGSGLAIRNELVSPITHTLLGREATKLGDIRVVYSHPQALEQCRVYIAAHLPNAEPVASLSTSAAVQEMLAADLPSAAIATEHAGELYGAHVLERGIEDFPNNMTRFVVLATTDHQHTGDDKTSICFSFDDDAPGILYSVLGEFATRGINLAKIESRPTREALGSYIFLVEPRGAQGRRRRQGRSAGDRAPDLDSKGLRLLPAVCHAGVLGLELSRAKRRGARRLSSANLQAHPLTEGATLSASDLARIHRRRASGQCPEAARGCSCESGIMVLKQQSRPQNKEHPIDATTQPSRSHPNRV